MVGQFSENYSDLVRKEHQRKTLEALEKDSDEVKMETRDDSDKLNL